MHIKLVLTAVIVLLVAAAAAQAHVRADGLREVGNPQGNSEPMRPDQRLHQLARRPLRPPVLPPHRLRRPARRGKRQSRAFVVMARAPSHLYDVVIHHKRIVCGSI